MHNDEIIVGMGELTVSRISLLTALGLGSCLSICAHDPSAHVSGMAHVVLPSGTRRQDPLPAKYADTGIDNLLRAMILKGAAKQRVNIAVAGGAQLLKHGAHDSRMDIGDRNIEAVRKMLDELGLKASAWEVGGSCGRTVRLYSDTGIVTVRTTEEPERLLVNLSV